MLLRDEKVRGRPCRSGARLVIGKQARRAARKNEAGLRGFAPQTKNGIAGVSLTLGCDGATVDADNVSLDRGGAFHAAKFLPCLTQGLGFVLVDLAAERDQKKFPGKHGADVRKSACLDKRGASRLWA